jgi:hypothetical protein
VRVRFATPAAAAVLAAGLLLGTAQARPHHSAAYASAEHKFAWIRENGQRSEPSTRPTVLTAAEWNAYLNEGGVKLPEGVSHVRILSRAGTARGEAEVDFDQLSAGRSRQNFLLALFTGKHGVEVTARVRCVHGIGHVHVEAVYFDGVEIPRLALEFFARRVLQPRYGKNIGLDSSFALHHRIETVTVGENEVYITQR